MSKSIICNDKECWVCKTTRNLERHHCFFGPNRGLSEAYGCWVWLCNYHHTGSNEAVHHNHDLDVLLKKTAQRRWEEVQGNREQFRTIFGKSYL